MKTGRWSQEDSHAGTHPYRVLRLPPRVEPAIIPIPKHRPSLDKASALFSGSDRSVTTIWEAKRGKTPQSKSRSKRFTFTALTQVLTRHDVHEERGQFVNEQHGGMVGYGEQQEENHRGSAGHAQSRASAEKISKPAGTRQKTQSEHLFMYVCWTKREIGGSPSKHGAPQQLDHAHRGLQITEPQGVEAQFLCQILESRTKRRFHITHTLQPAWCKCSTGVTFSPLSRLSEVIFHLHFLPYLNSSRSRSHKGTCLIFTSTVGV